MPESLNLCNNHGTPDMEWCSRLGQSHECGEASGHKGDHKCKVCGALWPDSGCPQYHEITFYCALSAGHDGDCRSPDAVRISTLTKVAEEMLAEITSGRLVSIGSINNTHSVQVSVASVSRWRQLIDASSEASC